MPEKTTRHNGEASLTNYGQTVMRTAERRSRSQPLGEISNQRAPQARQKVARGECEARCPWKLDPECPRSESARRFLAFHKRLSSVSLSPFQGSLLCAFYLLRRLLEANALAVVTVSLICSSVLFAQLSREQWGAMPVTVSNANGKWIIAGRKNKVTLNEADLALSVQAGPAQWAMNRSSATDMLVESKGEEISLRLADARKISIMPYDTGFKTGVKISLGGWKHKGSDLDLELFLTVCLEGKDEELVFDIAANEHEAVLRQLDWPTALDAREVDYTLLSNGRGTLLPLHWPKEYYPIRTITPEGKIAATDHSLLQ